MDDRQFEDGGSGGASLAQLALFAVVFFSALAAVEYGSGWFDLARATFDAVGRTEKAVLLAAFIPGVMAAARIASLVNGKARP